MVRWRQERVSAESEWPQARKDACMCGRFSLFADGEEVAAALGLAAPPFLAPRYNVAPTQPVAAVRLKAGSAERELTHFYWGLIPGWAKDPSLASRMINARAETVADKPAFRAAFKYRRCLIPASGFYEWRKLDGQKQPMHIQPADAPLFALAGLWEHWVSPDGSEIDSCAILTTDANERVRPIHDRMPVILLPEDYDTWLDPHAPPVVLRSLLKPYPPERLTAVAVGPLVNSPRNDSAELIRPIAES